MSLSFSAFSTLSSLAGREETRGDASARLLRSQARAAGACAALGGRALRAAARRRKTRARTSTRCLGTEPGSVQARVATPRPLAAPDDVVMVVQFLQEHDLAERALPGGEASGAKRRQERYSPCLPRPRAKRPERVSPPTPRVPR